MVTLAIETHDLLRNMDFFLFSCFSITEVTWLILTFFVFAVNGETESCNECPMKLKKWLNHSWVNFYKK